MFVPSSLSYGVAQDSQPKAKQTSFEQYIPIVTAIAEQASDPYQSEEVLKAKFGTQRLIVVNFL